jgi:hypothetical protein
LPSVVDDRDTTNKQGNEVKSQLAFIAILRAIRLVGKLDGSVNALWSDHKHPTAVIPRNLSCSDIRPVYSVTTSLYECFVYQAKKPVSDRLSRTPIIHRTLRGRSGE